MDYLSHNIGMNLKRIRKARGYSLDMVAEQTGVSKSMLAQIEKLTANPSIGVIGKITSGLRIDFNDLISTPPLDSYMVELNQLEPTKEVKGKYRVWTCFPISDNNVLEIYRIEILPGQEYYTGSHGEGTREYIMMKEGQIIIQLSDGAHCITEEQVFRFESDQEHVYRNVSNDMAVFDVVFLTK